MKIEAHQISKRFGSFQALREVDLQVPSGELVALLGPSGSGKTTLLRVIAGLESADSGGIFYDERDVTSLPVAQREVGFVFQNYALFNHMSVFENIAFGLRVRKWSKQLVGERVNELLKLIQLEDLGKRYPSQLSGGQRQRVALARALAPQPQVLLLDEPFGALDAKVRQELRGWLRHLHDEIHLTSVFVTHDQDEAFEVADSVVIMNKGRIEQTGTPEAIFAVPENQFVMGFLGNANVLSGHVQDGRATMGAFQFPFPDHSSHVARPATAYVRPHEIDIKRAPLARTDRDAIYGQIKRINRSGSLTKITLAVGEQGTELNVEVDQKRESQLRLNVGEIVMVAPRSSRVFVDA